MFPPLRIVVVRDCSKHSPRSLGSLETFSNPQTGAINHWSRKGEWAWRAAAEPSLGFRRASWVCVQDDSPYKWEMLQTCKGEDTKPYKYTFHLSANTCYAENLAGKGRREATLLKEKHVSRESPQIPENGFLYSPLLVRRELLTEVNSVATSQP